MPAVVQKFLHQIALSNKHTPDGIFLDNFVMQPVLVYGSLKKGFINNSMLMQSQFISEAYTEGNTYRMFGVNRGTGFNFPVVLDRDSTERKTEGHIFGEVYMVDTKTLMRLDRLENNGTMYERRIVKVRNPDAWDKPFDAWMYVGVQDFWRKHKKSLCLVGRNDDFNLYSWIREHESAMG